MGLLSLAIWLPIACGVLLLALGRDSNAGAVRWMALVGAFASFLVTLPLIGGFDTSTAAMQFGESLPWIERFNVRYALGVDGLSLWFVPLTAFITVIVVISAWEVITERVNQYMGAFLILSGLMVGVFSAVDGLLFYVFFEATLIPMYIIIGVWGGPRRVYAAFKFFLYTLAGSLLMLVALTYLYFKSGGSFDILTWHKLPLSATAQTLLFFAFFMAFAVKVPMWPVHTWLPDAHVEAPTGGSVVLAAIMLKLGAYGFLRFSLPIAPDASREWAWFIIALSLIAVIYIGLVALVQQDMKKLVAYSSIAHMGFCTLGFFIFSELGVSGGIVQMVSHGFVSGAMFLCIGVLYDRVHSREIASYGGVVNTMPKFAAFAVFFAMANSGLPGTSGFIGEWMVILGTVKAGFALALLAATALIFGAAYNLWMVKRVYFGAIANDKVKALTDLNSREFLMMAVLAIAVLWMGVYPKPFTDVMHVSVTKLLEHVAQSKLVP
ncbi:NADH-quinone oxidoreductase subunit M [Piscinibacter sp.]|uniref:NADH-quinone oxidoreductase subunit M n=1 Tax=Piscinibacter sp. TaxID=1903157 RepID=UPI0011D4779D|nr:NADH-quinone oxidoreductase subunit M [Piscinibacter sp.]MBP5989247.1 NADH-quinone oxidoreductase subunit M [Piscinibacter sp.]MBP6026831.1 NADH-quinone oxidoreductase subunit M [Piscinibacter sp.]TXH57992.1 MAG: NADH-quinone oxidoreductase subunit M [Burkholderiaceae bacterium]